MTPELFVTKNLPTLLFYLAAFVTVPFAFGVLFDRNIIRAGFLLIAVFGGISAFFLLLQAQFLAMAQMMIYAVGITLVVVIALMLTNPRMEDERLHEPSPQRIPALFTSIILFITLYLAIRSEPWTGQMTQSTPITNTDMGIIGIKLIRDYSLPFEFASILLLVALIGAVMLAKADHFTEKSAEEILDLNAEETVDDVVKV